MNIEELEGLTTILNHRRAIRDIAKFFGINARFNDVYFYENEEWNFNDGVLIYIIDGNQYIDRPQLTTTKSTLYTAYLMNKDFHQDRDHYVVFSNKNINESLKEEES